MKNLLFINGHLNAGGCERSLVDVLKHIDYDKYHVDLLLLEELGDYLNEIPEKINICLYSLKGTEGSFFGCLKSAVKQRDWFSFGYRLIHTLSSKISPVFLRLLRPFFGKLSSDYDVVIAYRPGICTELAAYTIKGKRKVSWWHHGEMLYTGEQSERLRNAYAKMDVIVTVSESVAEMLADHFSEITDKISVIPNMIISQEIEEKSKMYRPYEKNNNRIIVSVGRMSPEKHMIDAVYAMEKLIQKGYTDVQWYLVGDGAERSEIETEIHNRGLENKVICVGSQSNPYPYIADADIFVHPSYVESQGLTVLEALVLEKTSVVTRSLGVQEFIIDGKNAFIAEQSIDSLVEKIEFVLSHDNETLLDVQYQRKTVEQFSPKCVMQKITRLIEE